MIFGVAHRNFRVLFGVLVLSFAFGSLHAFGVLIEPLQNMLETERGSISLAYSLSIIGVTTGVFVSTHLNRLLTPQQIAILCGVMGASGLALVSIWPSLGMLLLGYGVLFGFSNGLAYSLFLEQAARALPQSKGLALGIATAMYGAGAAAFTQILSPLAHADTLDTAIAVLSFSMLLAGGLAALMFSRARIVVEQGNLPAPNLHPQARDIFRLWAIYCLAASGGLMVIVHAVGLMRGFGASEISIMAAPTLNAVGNIAGSLLGGVIADRLTARRALAVPLLISLISLVVMRVVSSEVALLGLMTACGFGYGALIAIVPVVIRKMFDPVHVGWVFGRVFTAWGIAGLVGPYVAGNIFDHTHGYELAIIASICCLACASGLNMFDNSRTHQETKDRELDK